jgi:hypothetical protein
MTEDQRELYIKPSKELIDKTYDGRSRGHRKRLAHSASTATPVSSVTASDEAQQDVALAFIVRQQRK